MKVRKPRVALYNRMSSETSPEGRYKESKNSNSGDYYRAFKNKQFYFLIFNLKIILDLEKSYIYSVESSYISFTQCLLMLTSNITEV